MKIFRIVLGTLAVIPVALIVDNFFFHPIVYYEEDSSRTLIYIAIGIPILILNMWAWIYPEIIEFYFFKKDK